MIIFNKPLMCSYCGKEITSGRFATRAYSFDILHPECFDKSNKTPICNEVDEFEEINSNMIDELFKKTHKG